MFVHMFSIGGASSSGKSLMAECIKYFLSPYIPVLIMRQDRFFKPEPEIELHSGTLEKNWEIPSALNMDAFHDTVTQIFEAQSSQELETLWLEKELHLDGQLRFVNSDDTSLPDWICTDALRPLLHSILNKLVTGKNMVILVDGFLLHYDPSITSRMHGNIFLSANYETCRHRRAFRGGYITKDGQLWEDPPNYFEDFVWPSYLILNERILNVSPVGQSYDLCNPEFRSDRINLDGQEILVLDSNDYGMEGILHNLQLSLTFISERIMMTNYDYGDRII